MGVTFGVMVVQDVPWPEWRRRVVECERLGYDGAYVWDHLVHRTLADGERLLDAFGALSAAAVVTTTIRLGTLVASPTLRHPYVLAKQATTVDEISGGRLDLGIGAAGVLRDYEVLGLTPWSKAEQVARFRETVEVVRAETSLPLTLAAHGPRTLRIAAEHATTWNVITPRDLSRDDALAVLRERMATLDGYERDLGRDRIRRSVVMGSDRWPVRRSVEDFTDAVHRLRDIGFDDFVVMYPDHPAEPAIGHGEAAPDVIQRVAEVLPDLRQP